MPEQEGLDDETIEQETAVELPERDAMSVVGAKLVPLATIATIAPEPAVSPEAVPTEPPPSPE